MTRNLSSGGIAFEFGGELKPGTSVELTIQWPVLLHGNVPIKLVVRGQIAWSEGCLAALRITRSHFRTQRRAMASGGSA